MSLPRTGETGNRQLGGFVLPGRSLPCMICSESARSSSVSASATTGVWSSPPQGVWVPKTVCSHSFERVSAAFSTRCPPSS